MCFCGVRRKKKERKKERKKEGNSVALVLERTIPAERQPIVTNFVPIFADRRCRLVSATDLHGRILSFLDRNKML
jgi:hypothetical protein